MNYLSVCSGIEAATCAWHPLGWNPVGFSEIEKFPRSVLQHHYPDVPLFGDFKEIQNEQLDRPIDLLVGGTPCQSFSVAGLRGGMDDDRGNLALEFCRLALRTRPSWIVWENVPGVLSSNEGRDFGSLLGALAECGYGFAYRILDAQFVRVESHAYAVPQRRRRVFVVGYLGDWRRAAAVLFERESMCGNPPPSRQTGEGFARAAANCLASGGCRSGERIGDTRGQDNVVVNAVRMTAFGQYVEDGTASTIKERDFKDATDLIIAFSAKDNGLDAGKISLTLRSMNNSESHANGGGQVAVAIQKATSNMLVRRLTPKECERLQGFPDDYTNVTYRKKPAADGPRYKAIGNSMAVNVMSWIGQRIQASEHTTNNRE